MKTINAKNGELVNIINGLFSVQQLKGKDFSLLVSKNISILQKALKELEDTGKPSEEFMALAEQVNAIANENKEDAKEQINKLEEENKDLVDARREQMDKVQKIMEEESEVSLHIIKEDLLPEEITAQQINKLMQIIE
tara:strand:- start:672 stop:1085 length:414 start_codon:yes stop_codon:yes gene_type:complete